MDIQEIRTLKDYYKDQLYMKVRAEQKIDDGFYKDEFAVPQLDSTVPISRTGSTQQIVDVPLEQISSAKLTASRKPIKDTQMEIASANRITTMFNDIWIDRINKMGLVKEFIKNQFLRGEAWIHPLHNESWVVAPYEKNGIPIIFLIPDPMIIYASPNEDENGVPENVIVFYERNPRIIKLNYPAWSNPEHKGGEKKGDNAIWMEYWDKDTRYFEADGEGVLGPQKNIYGFVPFVHKNGGFGKLYSPDGSMEDIIVSRIKKDRSLLQRECAIASDMDYIIHTFANRSIDVQGDDQHIIPPDFGSKYEIGTGLVHELPPGIKVTRSEELLPEPQMFQYLYALQAEIGRALPSVLSGNTSGQSGRLYDFSYTTAMKRWENIIKNTEYAFATAFSMSLEMMDKINKLIPDEIKKDDIDKYYEVTCSLKPEDPVEEDRLSTLGQRLWNGGNGCIDLRTNLTKYQGYSQEQTEEIIADILVDKLTLYNPDVAQVMGMVFAEESGMVKYIEEAKKNQQMQLQQQQALQQVPPPSAVQRTQGQAQTPLGKEMVDIALSNRGARTPPQAYTRGQ